MPKISDDVIGPRYVRYDVEQDLSLGEQEQARDNLGIENQASVLYTPQSLSTSEKDQALTNIGLTYGVIPSTADADDIRAPYVSKRTIVFTDPISLTETLDLTGLNSKTLVSMVPYGTPLISSSVDGTAVALQGNNISFQGNWRIEKSGAGGGIGIDIVGSTRYTDFDFLWLQNFDIGFRAHMNEADFDQTTIKNLYMRGMLTSGVDLKATLPYHVTQFIVGNVSARRLGGAGDPTDNCTWFKIGPSIGSNGNNGVQILGGGLQYGGAHFLHMYDDQEPINYNYANAPRKVQVSRIGLRANTSHAIWLEQGHEVDLNIGIDDAGVDNVGHGIYVGEGFQGDYTFRQCTIVNCTGSAVRDEAIVAMGGRIIGGQFCDNSVAPYEGDYSALYFDSRVSNRQLIGVRAGVQSHWRRPYVIVTFDQVPTPNNTITINGYQITWVNNSNATPPNLHVGGNTGSSARLFERFISNSTAPELAEITPKHGYGVDFFGEELGTNQVLLMLRPGSEMNGTTISTNDPNVSLSSGTFGGGNGTIKEKWGVNGIVDGRRGCVIDGGLFYGINGGINPSPDYVSSSEPF